MTICWLSRAASRYITMQHPISISFTFTLNRYQYHNTFKPLLIQASICFTKNILLVLNSWSSMSGGVHINRHNVHYGVILSVICFIIIISRRNHFAMLHAEFRVVPGTICFISQAHSIQYDAKMTPQLSLVGLILALLGHTHKTKDKLTEIGRFLQPLRIGSHQIHLDLEKR